MGDYWVKMDVQVREGVLAHLRKYGGSVFAVWMCLGAHVGKDGTCWPSVATICRETGYSRGTVQAATRILADEGIIAKHARISKQGDPSSNLYDLKGWFRFGKG